jgi:hypothetical protein
MTNAEQLAEQLKGVAMVASHPKVVFPYGCRVVEIAGEKVLRPLTPAEYKELVLAKTGKTLTDEDLMLDKCLWGWYTGCVNVGCNGQCNGPYWDSKGAVYCVCNCPPQSAT